MLLGGLLEHPQFPASRVGVTGIGTNLDQLFVSFLAPDQINPDVPSIDDSQQRHWALASLEMPLDEVDEADEDALNRILWHARRGRDDTYPEWAVPTDGERGASAP